MAFKWKCNCGKDIVVPYESPNSMSPYSYAICTECFNAFERCDITGEEYEIDTEIEEVTCNCYSDINGIIFECKLYK